jgi:ActR/RegA family two-component response regulator
MAADLSLRTHNARKLLIVIDRDHLFNAVLSAALSKRGFAVASAHSVGEAMTIIAKCRPQTAVLDIDLGELSGLVLIPLLRAANPNCRVLVLTAHISLAVAMDVASLGAGEVLTKPADADAVIRALQRGEVDGAALPAPFEAERESQGNVLPVGDGRLTARQRVVSTPAADRRNCAHRRCA